MARRYHELRLSFFIQATEDEEKVLQAVANLLGMDPSPLVNRSNAEGVHHNPIILLSIELKKEREIRAVLERWETTDFWQESKKDIDDRLDEDLVYHVRVDKEKAFGGDIALWKGGESIDIRLKVATYPSSREGSIEIILNGP
ncbi:MAG: RNA-binding domain-containing protein [Thermoplasmatota archaeon]